MSSFVRKAVTSAVLASMAFSIAPAVAQAASTTSNDPSSPSSSSTTSLPNGEQRYIVRYENDVNAKAESDSLKQKGIEVKNTISHSIKASVVVASQSEIESVKKSDDVVAVERDYPISIAATTSVWGLDRVDQRSKTLDGQYNIDNEGAGVNVYVVDTGLYAAHTEYSGRVLNGWTGINDGKGTSDCNGHGTHVAGTIAGTTYGVAKKANIIPIRALECDGSGWTSTAIAGIDWAIANHVAGQPAVMNMSMGGFTSTSFDQSVQNAVNDGITVVAAAGNSGEDACNASPARVPSAITVAATDKTDTEASWSSYGSCVDIHAPGVSILSAGLSSPTATTTMSGTSMATPHVSGAAAVLLSRDHSLTPAQVQQQIVSNATTGTVTAIKGSTPNKLLYIPAPLLSVIISVPSDSESKTLEAVDTGGTLWSYNAPGNSTLGSRFSQGTGWGTVKQILKVDWNNDGILDLVARWSSGYVTMYAGIGNNDYRAPITIGTGWQNYDINATKLKKTDKYPGMVARNTVDGKLYYYSNPSGGAMSGRIVIGGAGWIPMTEISALDWDKNGNMDLIARNSAGELKLYRTNGAGVILNESRLTVGAGWGAMNHIAAQPDFAGTGTVGIIARNVNGYLYYYPISGGKIQSSTKIGSGWAGYTIAAGTP